MKDVERKTANRRVKFGDTAGLKSAVTTANSANDRKLADSTSIEPEGHAGLLPTIFQPLFRN